MLTALMTTARKNRKANSEYTKDMLINRVLAFNFLSAYTNSISLANAILDLASLPEPLFSETIEGMRDEIHSALEAEGGWTSNIASKLHLMDSFIHESLRFSPIGETGLERVITKKGGYTFSNGVHVAEGATLAAPIRGIQHDPDIYPGGFDPRRFLKSEGKQRLAPSAQGDVSLLSTPSPGYLTFGLGNTSCPGRFFTANLLKLAIAHIVIEYDLEHLDKKPEPTPISTIMQPNPNFNLRLKPRKV